MGEKGIFLFEKNNRSFEKSKNFEAEVSDVTGAGDTVISSFCVNYLQTKDKISSLNISAKAASISVSKYGTYLFHIEIFQKKKKLNDDNLFQSIENLKLKENSYD